MAELMGYEFCVSVFACCFVAFYLMYVSKQILVRDLCESMATKLSFR